MFNKSGKTDFIVVDVRPRERAHKGRRIPGAIYIPQQKILEPENLAKLPKDKKLVLFCTAGQLQDLPVEPLRELGYDVSTLTRGYISIMQESSNTRQVQDVEDE